MGRLRSHLSYANVMATTAMFIAIGGTSYAVTALPRNSVGANQIRAGAVGKSELRSSAVRSGDIRNRSVALKDISLSARASLRGQQGPIGPQGPPGASTATLAAAVDSGGGHSRSSGLGPGSHTPGSGLYEARASRDLSRCYAVASLSDVPGGLTSTPDAGEVVTSIQGSSVLIRTRNSAGAPQDLPFHLIVSC